jgi:hypothetical protein
LYILALYYGISIIDVNYFKQVSIIAISLVAIAIVYIVDFRKRATASTTTTPIDALYFERLNGNLTTTTTTPIPTTKTLTTSTMYPGN